MLLGTQPPGPQGSDDSWVFLAGGRGEADFWENKPVNPGRVDFTMGRRGLGLRVVLVGCFTPGYDCSKNKAEECADEKADYQG